MKYITWFLKFSCIAMLCGGLLVNCRKNDAIPENPVQPPPPPVNQGGSTNADTISNHLRFFNATKKQGTIPKGPAGSSLKISFKDTLYLMDELKRPIKFLHEDTTQDVAGAFVQVHVGTGGGASSFYYDVPEEPLMADNDTVSVILVGIDPNGLIGSPGVPPAGAPFIFDVTITPYGENGNPLAEETKPVSVSEPKTGTGDNAGACGLVLEVGEYWDWILSYQPNENGVDFINEPSKVWGAGGQFIRGSCCDGNSFYGICPGDTAANSRLHFATHYQILFERLQFQHNGTFLRQSLESTPTPEPDESDFCGSGNGEGIVKPNLNHMVANGNYSVNKIKLPSRFDSWVKHDTLSLTLQHTSSTGGGFGNPGGVIHQLDCKVNSLVLMQLDREGGESDLFKFYERKSIDEPRWYPFGNT